MKALGIFKTNLLLWPSIWHTYASFKVSGNKYGLCTIVIWNVWGMHWKELKTCGWEFWGGAIFIFGTQIFRKCIRDFWEHHEKHGKQIKILKGSCWSVHSPLQLSYYDDCYQLSLMYLKLHQNIRNYLGFPHMTKSPKWEARW